MSNIDIDENALTLASEELWILREAGGICKDQARIVIETYLKHAKEYNYVTQRNLRS